MSESSTRQRLITLAMQRLGKDALAGRLKIPVHLLEAWASGHASMPDRKLIELARIIEESGDA